MIELVVIFLVIFVIGFFVAAAVWKYSFLDYLVPVWLMMPLWLRSQFSLKLSFFFLGEVYLGEIWAVLGIGLFGILACSMLRGQRMSLAPAMIWAVVFFPVTLLVSMVVAPSLGDGFARALQANLMWMSAFVGALGMIAMVPATEEHHDRLVQSFVGAFGYVYPAMVIIVALFPGIVSRFMGWDLSYSLVGGKFIRASSPVGSGISTGMLVLMAMGLALGQIWRGRNVWLYLPALVVGVAAILFSLARSVFLAMGIFAVIYLFRAAVANMRRSVIVGIVMALVLVPFVAYMHGTYDLSRLVDFREVQQSLRFNSAVAAFDAFMERPVTGYGAGQLYHAVRVPELLQEGSSGQLETVIIVAGRPSAREPHNFYLMVLVEYGLVGFLMIAAGVILWLRALRRASRHSSPRWSPLSDAYWAGAIAWMVFSITNSGPVLNTKTAFAMWTFFFMSLHNAEVVRRQVSVTSTSVLAPEDPVAGAEVIPAQ